MRPLMMNDVVVTILVVVKTRPVGGLAWLGLAWLGLAWLGFELEKVVYCGSALFRLIWTQNKNK